MCMDPATAAAIAAVVSATASAAQGIAGYQTGRANANMAEEQARLEQTAAAHEASRFQQNLDAELGAMLARQGASGFMTDRGSPLIARALSAGEGAKDKAYIQIGGEQRAAALKHQAAVDRFGANMSLLNGTLGAGADLLGGYSQWKSLGGGSGGSGGGTTLK